MKCAGNHKSTDCTEIKSRADIKCALCNGNHTANYKGCEIFQKLKRQRFPATTEEVLPVITNEIINNPPESTQQAASFAQIVSNGTKNSTTLPKSSISTNNDLHELKEIMKQLLTQMSNMMNVITLLLTKFNNN